MDQNPKMYTEEVVREIVAKAYERCAAKITTWRSQIQNDKDIGIMHEWAADIRSGKENLE